jgi:hypothetical protein
MNKNILLIYGIGITLVLTLAFVSSYTAPTYSSINFTLTNGYTAPTYSSINFTLTDSETTSCAVLNGDVWYVPANCTCYKATSSTELYLNLNDWSCI